MAHDLLKGKKGIIFGALNDMSIAWKVAESAYDEGASLVLTNAPVAMRMGEIKELSKRCGNAPVIAADATSEEDLSKLFDEAMEKLGGRIDFILHSIGMSHNLRRGKEYVDSDYGYFHKTLDVSAMSLHRVLKTAYHKDAINEWGSVVALSFIAAQRIFPHYNDMADAKALLESISRGFGYYYGKEKKVRVNTVSQSPTLTTAGSGVEGFHELMAYMDAMSPLGNADAQSCADYCLTLFSDHTRYVTMQNLYHDGGFSFTGLSPDVVTKFE